MPILLATVTVLGSTWAAHSLGFSPALGAFIAGLLLASTPFAVQIRADVSALRTLFVTLFFASIGMLADPRFVQHHWLNVIGFVGLIVVGKALIIWPIALLFRNPLRYAIATGISLAQVGEFSFLLAQVARARGILDEYIFQLFISATVATLFLTPFLVTSASAFGVWVERKFTRRGIPPQLRGPELKKLSGHVIVVGYGPAGRMAIETIHKTGIHVLVIEMNPRTVSAIQQQEIDAVVGDASQPEVLEHAQVGLARAVIVTVPDYRIALQVIRQVLAISPRALVIARARYHTFAADLEAAGAHVVVDEEEGIGSALGDEVLKLGSTLGF